MKRNALGRGLDSLISIGDVQTEGSSAINEIDLELIHPNPDQPRLSFDDETLGELAASIRELGVVQPLSLREDGTGNYQIIAGERRWRAARLAGLKAVPAYIRKASDSEVTEMALIENIQREDLNAIEIALAFRKLIEDYNLTQERLSERLGKKRATIANHLRLLKLPAEIQLGLRDRKLDMGHARALLAVTDPKQQLRLYNLIIREGLSVRRVEELVKKLLDNPDPDSNNNPGSKERLKKSKDIESRLSAFFPKRVKVALNAEGKGSVSLKFTSEKELNEIIDFFERKKPEG